MNIVNHDTGVITMDTDSDGTAVIKDGEMKITHPESKQEYSEEEQAAARFLYLLPYVRKFSKTIGGGGATRVLHALAEFPLGQGKPRLLNQKEKELFDIMQELQASKSVIIKGALEKQSAATTAETEVKDGSTN